MHAYKGMISIWFFIGSLLVVFGVLILGAGISEWSSPPPTVLTELHAPVWWGALLLALGLFYCLKFRPKR